MGFQLFKKKDKDGAKSRRGSPDDGGSLSSPPSVSSGFKTLAPSIAPSTESSASSSSSHRPAYNQLAPGSSSARSPLNSYRPSFASAEISSSASTRSFTAPPPPPHSRVTAAPFPAILQTRPAPHLNAVKIPTTSAFGKDGDGSWDDLGVPLSKSPTTVDDAPVPPPPDRAALFGGSRSGSGESGGSGSSVSLPITPTTETQPSKESGKRSRWMLGGGGAKKRSGSVASMSGVEANLGKENSNSGFVVKSFRQVSKVQGDPISPGPYESLPASPSPPLPMIPLPSPLNVNTSSNSLPRPSLTMNTRVPSSSTPPPSAPWNNETNERPPSPSTISVDAFRQASANRSKSSLSISSATSFDHHSSSDARPRFEPQRSRGPSSSGVETLTSSTSAPSISPLAPPRPKFASSHSRSSSAGSATPNRPIYEPVRAAGGYASLPSSPNMSASVSANTIASYATAETTVAPLSHSQSSKRTSGASSDGFSDELRFIALYGAGDQSPPVSPVLGNSGGFSRSLGAPLVAVQPASPVVSNSPTNETPKRIPPPPPSPTSKTAPAVQSRLSPVALASTAPALTKNEKSVKRGFASWNSNSSDEDSDASSDEEEEEDNMPLGRLAPARGSASSLALTTSASGTALDMARKPSNELEILDSPPLAAATVPSPQPSPQRLPPPIVTSPSALRPDPARGNARQSQRSMSVLSISDNAILEPPAPISNHPTRTYSNPSSPTITNYGAPDLPSLSSSTPSLSPLRSAFAQHKSGSSSSGSGSGLSLPQTPKDGSSPAPSDIGVKPSSGAERTIRFDIQSMDNEADRKWRSRMSTQPGLFGHQRTPSAFAAAQQQQSLPRSSSAMGFNGNAPFAAGSTRPASSMSVGRPNDTVYSRMKARHRAETSQAEKLGRDLNGTGLEEEDDDEEDDELPLSSLAGRGHSQAGSVNGSYHSTQQSAFLPPPPSLMGGYTLAMAPPGVDFYLYSSLPADQKQALHARSQQMMAALSAQAYQARAESVAGWESGSNASGSSSIGARGGGGGSLGRNSPLPTQQPSMQQPQQQMGYPMWPPPMGMPNMNMWGAYPQQPFMMPSSRLPPFAPSMAASQQFFQHPGQGYGYASSAIGMPSIGNGGTSNVGAGAGGRRGPASTIGYSRGRGQ